MVRLWLLIALFAQVMCPAQVTGSFSIEKSAFVPGEPVFLSLMLHNAGKQPEEVSTADPYSFCSGYKIDVSRGEALGPACLQEIQSFPRGKGTGD